MQLLKQLILMHAIPALLAAQCNRVRYFPAPKGEQAMVGGRIEGSNVSPQSGFETIGEIKTAPPAGQWSEIALENRKVYRWLRYEGPPGSYGKIGKIEFYSGERKLSGPGGAYGSVAKLASHSYQKAFDGQTASWFESHIADHQFVGVDLRDAATARTPVMKPPPGDFAAAMTVTLECPTPGAAIRYTLDGSTPTAESGVLYSGPVRVTASTTIVAAAFLPGRAPSPIAEGTYLIPPSAKPGLSTFHLGNSLTQTANQFEKYARSAGYSHQAKTFAMPGAPTIKLWNVGRVEEKERWESIWNSVPRVDHLTLQPRDFNIAEEADYSIRFINLIREKSPDLQPWLYTEWTEEVRERPTDKGEVPSSQMRRLYPALTWEESMGAMLLYVEELERKIGETYHCGKRPRVLPVAIAMGWIRNMIDSGKFPGVAPGSFYPVLFRDQVHPNANGAYLVDLTWYAAFYGESPEGKVLPFGTDWTPEQARLLQRLAWDVIKNYPDAGLYEAGTKAAGKPAVSPGPKAITSVTPVTLSSSTPGAWFRYTLDGSIPTRTSGYVYCGVVSVRPGTALKAVAFKSGMADSDVSEYSYPAESVNR